MCGGLKGVYSEACVPCNHRNSQKGQQEVVIYELPL